MESIEELFFNTFGIEKTAIKMPYGEWDYKWPEITDKMYLEMVCILNKFTGYTLLLNDNIAEIKVEILKDSIFVCENLRAKYRMDLKRLVKRLFKEETKH